MEHRKTNKPIDRSKRDHRKHHKSSSRPHHLVSDSKVKPTHVNTLRDLQSRNHLPPLSEDQNYIRQWLARTDKTGNETNDRSTMQDSGKPEKDYTDRSRKRESNSNFLRLAANEVEAPRGRKRKHNSSSDSSLIQPATKKLTAVPRKRATSFEPSVEPTPRQGKKKRHPTKSSDDVESSMASAREEIFEKRARHKTREDRYESKKQEKLKTKDGEKITRTKRVKRGDAARAARKAGADLISNFTSKNIGQERLTVHPSLGLGLFKNGRASSSVKRRGLPDLAFSEMDFLQRNSRAVPVENEEKNRSKYRDKDKLRSERTHIEISTFFKRGRLPLQEASLNSRSISFPVPRSPDYNGDSCEIFNPVRSVHSAAISRHRISKQPIEQNPAGQSNPKPDTIYSRRGEKTISWSETQLSRRTTQPRSATPESVRISIDNTRVFEGTGIKRSRKQGESHARKHRAYSESRESAHIPIGADIRSTGTLLATRSCESPSINTVTLPEPIAPQQKRTREPGDCMRQTGQKSGNTTGSPDENLEQPVIEHFNPKIGWQPNKDIATSPRDDSHRSKILQEMRKEPIDREQLARTARERRPLTTVPVIKDVAKEGLTEDVNKDVMEQSQDTLTDPTNTKESMSDSIAREESTCQANAVIGLEHGSSPHFINEAVNPNVIGIGNLDDQVETSDRMAVDAGLADEFGYQPNSGLQQKFGSEGEEANMASRKEINIARFTASESWIHLGQHRPRSRLSPVIEVAPLYFQQLHRHDTLEVQAASFENLYMEDKSNHAIEDYHIEPNTFSMADYEDVGNESGLLVEMDHYLAEYHPSHEMDVGDCDIDAPDFLMPDNPWQPANEYNAEALQFHDTPQYKELHMSTLQSRQHEYTRQDLKTAGTANYDAQGLSSEEGISTRRFWRPNRQY